MQTENINTFLIIDDDPSIILSLTDLIQKSFINSVVYSATDGNSGWSTIEKVSPTIILSAISIPGISGAQIYKKIRTTKGLTDIYFIAMVPTVDKISRIKMLEEGADDYINKPFQLDEMMNKLYIAQKFCELRIKHNEANEMIKDLAKELETDINDMLMMSLAYIRMRVANAPMILRDVAQAAMYIAKSLLKADSFNFFEIKAASLLAYTGKIFLPDEIINDPVLLDGQATNELMYRIPLEAKEVLEKTSRFKEIAPILYHVYENYDGTGFPERLKTWQIPFPSRILRACLDYYEALYLHKRSPVQIINDMQAFSKRLYDHRVVILLEQYLAATKAMKTGINEKPIKLNNLKDGMLVTRDVFTNNGLKLIAAGTQLTEDRINKILAHNSSDPILGNIFVSY